MVPPAQLSIVPERLLLARLKVKPSGSRTIVLVPPEKGLPLESLYAVDSSKCLSLFFVSWLTTNATEPSFNSKAPIPSGLPPYLRPSVIISPVDIITLYEKSLGKSNKAFGSFSNSPSHFVFDAIRLLEANSLPPPYANNINIAEDCPACFINILLDLSIINL